MSTTDSELENSYSFVVSQAILGILVSTPAVVTNVLLLVTVFRDPNRNQPLWGSPVTLLVVNLAMCDLLTGAIPGYFSLYYDIASITGQPTEELFGVRTGMTVAAVVANIVSSCTIAAMAFDRLFAVSSPHQYTVSVTKAKIKVFIVVAWIYSLLFSSLGWMGVSVTGCCSVLPHSCVGSTCHPASGILEDIPCSSLAQQSSTKFGWWERENRRGLQEKRT